LVSPVILRSFPGKKKVLKPAA
jgi:hypothetical protein